MSDAVRVPGTYVPGDSPFHRADPRAKVVEVLLVMVALFVARTPAGLLATAAAAVLTIALSGLGPRAALATLRPFVWLMAFVFVFDALLAEGGVAAGAAGAEFGALSVARFALVLLAASCLMRTTTPTQLTDATCDLLGHVVRRRSALNDFSLAMGITFRYIPVLAREWARVREAQEVRLARFDEGGPAARLRAYLPVIVPVFVRAYRSSEALALAVQNRGYDPTLPRTRYRAYRFRAADAALVAMGVASLAAAILA